MGLISKIRGYWIKKRIFKKDEVLFSRDFAIRHAKRIRWAIENGDMGQAQARQLNISSMGLNPPKTIKECIQFIEDVKHWRT